MIRNRFSSIKWKFIVVYFLLVFIAMAIVGVFIVEKLEVQQIENINRNMEVSIEAMERSSSYFLKDEWIENRREIQETLDEWRIDNNQVLYVLAKNKNNVPKIIAASSLKDTKSIVGKNAYSYHDIEPTLIDEAYAGNIFQGVFQDKNDNKVRSHLAYPVYTDVGKVKGVIYMTSDLKDVFKTMKDSRIILTNATLIALAITVSLGFLIANSIVEPIRDVTKKAEEMALGDFNQKVDVKSRDEIGQLANMFNYLTLKLKDTIEEIDLERSKLDAIFRYMAEGVAAVDKEGYIIHANPTASKILENLNIEEKISGDFFEELLVKNKLGSTNIKEIEGDYISEILGEVYKIKYAPFKTESEDMAGLILVFQNMTNEYKLDDMRKEFVANVSHELKTPITTIKSYTETLMLGDIEKDMQLTFLQVIDGECNRMGRLVTDLLELSNLDFKKTVWNKEDIDLSRLIEEIVRKLEFSFEEKKQKYKIELMSKEKYLSIDRDAIEQVLINIISNAIKYTPEEGLIKITTSDSYNFVTISIEDNGIGIPNKDLERIFERFYRVEKARTRDAGGTGLGLAIAKEIVEGHNGFIEMTSREGKGTKVDIRLPK